VGTLATETASGTGNAVFAAEFGSPGSIAIVEARSNGGKCRLAESPKSPVTDPQSPGLLSIGVFPPRSFQTPAEKGHRRIIDIAALVEECGRTELARAIGKEKKGHVDRKAVSG
jgi:hypothetical protein